MWDLIVSVPDHCLSFYFTSIWKSSVIMPLFKKGESNLPSNYRSISLLSCVGKLMERLVYKHVYNYLIENSLIYKKSVWISSWSFDSISNYTHFPSDLPRY